MPLVDSNLQEVWDSLYESHGVNGVVYHYTRAAKQDYLGDGHWTLLRVLGIQLEQTIGLIGCGFGWVAEDWAAAGYGPIAAVDTSTWIQANKATEASVTILNADVSSNNGRIQVKQALGITGNNKANWMITEDVLPLLSDAECQQLNTFLHNLSDNVVHWLTEIVGDGSNQDPRLNWKTIVAWKALLPDAIIVSRQTGQRL